MNIFLTAIVFLLGCCAGLLVLIYRRHSRDADRVLEATERVAESRLAHANAVATVMLNSQQQIARDILKELRKAAKDRRELMDYLMGDAPVPESGDDLQSGPESGARSNTTPGSSTLPPDAPTSRSGYSVGQLLGEARHGPE